MQAQQAQADARHTLAQAQALGTMQVPGGGYMHGAVPGVGMPPMQWPPMSAPMAGHPSMPAVTHGLAACGAPSLPAAMGVAPQIGGMPNGLTGERLTQLFDVEMQHGHLLQVVGAPRNQIRGLGTMPCA